MLGSAMHLAFLTECAQIRSVTNQHFSSTINAHQIKQKFIKAHTRNMKAKNYHSQKQYEQDLLTKYKLYKYRDFCKLFQFSL